MTRRKKFHRQRRGVITALMAVLLIPLLAMVAFSIDLGYLALAQNELQKTADAAAMAGAAYIETHGSEHGKAAARNAAESLPAANKAANSSVVLDQEADLQFGYWNANTRGFEPPRFTSPVINALRVRLRRDATNVAGPIEHYFAPLLGINSSDAAAESIAFIPQPVPSKRYAGRGTRFLIDDEMFDHDEFAIIDLANDLGVSPEWLVNAADEESDDARDWFLNLPPGVVLELPTGQVGDEGLLDIAINDGHPDRPQYPFSSREDHVNFLKYNDMGNGDPISEWRSGLFTDQELDPVRGVGRFNQPSLYPELVNPEFVHVSPVYKSDISALDGVKDKDEDSGPDLNGDGTPDGYTTNDPVNNGVSAKGYRRGLVAFRIVGFRIDPGRPYPYLPNLIIEIVDPVEIDLDQITAVDSAWNREVFSSGGVHNVRLAR